jgi:hypothetical protein
MSQKNKAPGVCLRFSNLVLVSLFGVNWRVLRTPAAACYSPCAGIKALACTGGVLPSLSLGAVTMATDQYKFVAFCRLHSWNTSHVFAASFSSRLTPLRSAIDGRRKLQMFGTSNEMRSSSDTHTSPFAKPVVASTVLPICISRYCAQTPRLRAYNL